MENPQPEKCPKCGCVKLLGLMGSFWVELNLDGEPVKPWQDFSSETEVTENRMCTECDHEWNPDAPAAPSLITPTQPPAGHWRMFRNAAGDVCVIQPSGEVLNVSKVTAGALMATAELLLWRAVADERPNDGESVMGFNVKWCERTGLCYLDGDEWKSAEGYTMSTDKDTDPDLQPPTHWAPWPQGPKL